VSASSNTASVATTTGATANTTTVTATGMTVNFANSNIGSGLIDEGYSVSLGAPAPAGGVQVTLTSSNPAALLLSTNASPTGVGTLVVTVPAGSSSAVYNIQGVEGITTTTPVTIAASAPGYTNASAVMNIVRAGIRIVSVTTSTTSLSNNTGFTVQVGTTTSNGTVFSAAQSIRPGGVAIPVTVSLQNSTPAGVAEIDPPGSPFDGSAVGAQSLVVTIPVGFQSVAPMFDPLLAGTVQVSASSNTASVATTTGATAATTTVTAPGITVNFPNANIGSGLMDEGYSVSLGAPAPIGGLQLTLTSSNPGALLLSTNANPTGVGTLVVTVPAGNTSFSYNIQGVEGITVATTATITASAPGFTNGIAVMNIVRAGIRIFSVPTSTGSASSNSVFTVQVGTTTSNGTVFGSTGQVIRPGGVAIPVTVSLQNSTPAGVAELDPPGSPANGSAVGAQSLIVTIPVGGQLVQPQFDPLVAGTVQVSASSNIASVANTTTATAPTTTVSP